jgi:8-oxo-dGTP pyrophosphatase MutT (NUDIX family)
MAERLTEEITKIASTASCRPEIKGEYIQRLGEGLLTRDENPQTHYCVYFAGIDSETGKFFVGHHKKSGLWLFNGGHIDKGETPREAVLREIGEEWGDIEKTGLTKEAVGKPELLTITTIKDPDFPCKKHYDIWFFIRLNKDLFKPDKEKLEKEFYKTKWVSLDEARKLIVDPATIEALDYLNK